MGGQRASRRLAPAIINDGRPALSPCARGCAKVGAAPALWGAAVKDGDYVARGLRLMDIGDYDQAVVMFDSALRLGLGDLAEIQVCRAESLAWLGAWAAAEAGISEALKLEPFLASAFHARGVLRQLQGKRVAAIADFTTAIHIEPDDDEAYFNRGLLHEESRQYAAAEADLTRALLLNPELGAAYEARGRARARQFKYDLAIADIKHYLRSGAGKLHDNHSEIQGYLLILRIQRLLWGLLSRWRR